MGGKFGVKRPDVVLRNKSLKIRLALSESHKSGKRTKAYKKISLALKGNKNGLGSKHPHSLETIEKIRSNTPVKYGKLHPNWKGNNASYIPKHTWIKRKKGNPKRCVDCGKTKNESRLHWSNKDHKYSRNIDDYLGRCPSCHYKYDIKNGLRKHYMGKDHPMYGKHHSLKMRKIISERTKVAMKKLKFQLP